MSPSSYPINTAASTFFTCLNPNERQLDVDKQQSHSPTSFPVSTKMDKVDNIQESQRRDIEHCRLSSSKTFGITVYVCPTQTAEALFDGKRTWIGWDEYTLDVWDQPDKPMTVSIDNIGDVRISYQKQWSRVTSYLRHVKPAVDWSANNRFPDDDVKFRRWQQQARWLLANRKTFAPLKQPAEVREVIYGFCFRRSGRTLPDMQSSLWGSEHCIHACTEGKLESTSTL